MEGSAAPIAQRVTDADRDGAARILGSAVADGRLSFDTFLARLDLALTSRDEVALREAVADLVGPPRPRRTRFASARLFASRRGAQVQTLPTVCLPESSRAAEYLSIGRTGDSDICCDHPTVSARHAGLVFFGGSWYVVDRDSTNGTFVNEGRIQGATPVYPGDVLGLGCATVVLVRPRQRSFTVWRARLFSWRSQ